ncbi:MetQ/NlpA family ABC transporter substrate-binding protein [Alicyclobacillus macrosporangiidus]|uniref:Lipoprotein n=1 Tax=Alicyclobacillus macrosporangiidus TaxID=392015 RepID=A0A1I7JDM2_9BACL|nr:MetQ/NlpA family ABC transporter substrate-binding protein [Alicyclobacillus macrosporangiidus]SFU83300.1 D-methionine transport system substrate-binding protein [Alicyclobacillus macrosporangiidus]
MPRTSIVRWAAALLASAALVAGCGASQQGTPSAANESTAASTEPVVLKVGASPVPHAEILNAVKPILAKEGIDLQVVEFQDYVQPNRALAEGSLDANFFQHVPYLNEYNQQNHTDLVPTVSVHFEPLGLYPGRSTSLSNIPDGAKIAVPNDTTNEARALLLLQSAGVISLKQPLTINETKQDITANPHHVQIVELDAASIPRHLKDVDYAVINGNYAVQAGLTIDKALTKESADSLAAKTYANVVVVRKGDENKPAIQKLDEALQSDTVRQFIEQHYHGSVVPVFDALKH